MLGVTSNEQRDPPARPTHLFVGSGSKTHETLGIMCKPPPKKKALGLSRYPDDLRKNR